MDWLQMAQSRKEELIKELQELIQIPSVLDNTTISDEAPFGQGPLKALKYMLNKGKEQGFTVKNVDQVAGHIEMGQGEELLGILCHVDVVPAGDNWEHPPFKGEIIDGKIYGRGALDDKGPTMAAWLAMKMVKDAKIPLAKRVRMIIGSDEESGFRCVKRYFQKEEMPTIGFVPDADFPLIHAEKGIADLQFTQKNYNSSDEQLISFEAGSRTNMVPDEAVAVVQNVDEHFKEGFQQFFTTYDQDVSLVKENQKYKITVKGISAHAMEPEKGKNAAIILATFLMNHITTKKSKEFLSFIVTTFGKDFYGEQLNIQYKDEVSGPTTLNPGIVKFDSQNGGIIQVSMRYSVTFPFEQSMEKMRKHLENTSFTVDVIENSSPHYVPEDDELVTALLKVYRKFTGDVSKPLSTGGGTYARAMKKAVAYGMLFPGEKDVSHQKDEHISIDNLLKASAIYAEAIVELAGKKS